MIIPILIGIIIVLCVVIDNQRKYIKVVEDISKGKSVEIDLQEQIIEKLLYEDNEPIS